MRVELVSGMGREIALAPGRVMLASPQHTLADLATAINIAFARWDLAHLHLFRIGELSFTPEPEDDDEGDSENVRLRDLELKVGSQFTYTFDLGDDWTHRCRIEAIGVDPEEALGEIPVSPLPIFGWGSIPDQYGRDAPGQDVDAGI